MQLSALTGVTLAAVDVLTSPSISAAAFALKLGRRARAAECPQGRDTRRCLRDLSSFSITAAALALGFGVKKVAVRYSARTYAPHKCMRVIFKGTKFIYVGAPAVNH